MARSVPIYWGSVNTVEPGLVNQDAILFWNQGGDNSKVLEIVSDLHTHPKHYDEFIAQPPLLPALADYVFDRYRKVENHLKSLL